MMKKTRMAFMTLKSTGKLIATEDTVAEALRVNMMVRDYEAELVKLNPQLDIEFKVVSVR